MFNTRITENTEKQTKRYSNKTVSFPDKPIGSYKPANYSTIINKAMFTGLAVTSAVIFYIAIASLML